MVLTALRLEIKSEDGRGERWGRNERQVGDETRQRRRREMCLLPSASKKPLFSLASPGSRVNANLIRLTLVATATSG